MYIDSIKQEIINERKKFRKFKEKTLLHEKRLGSLLAYLRTTMNDKE